MSNENEEGGMFGVHEFPFKSQKKHLERMHPSHVTQYDEFVAGSHKRRKDNIVTSVDRVQRNNA